VCTLDRKSTRLSSDLEAVERLRLGMVYDFDPDVVNTLSRIVERSASFSL